MHRFYCDREFLFGFNYTNLILLEHEMLHLCSFRFPWVRISSVSVSCRDFQFQYCKSSAKYVLITSVQAGRAVIWKSLSWFEPTRGGLMERNEAVSEAKYTVECSLCAKGLLSRMGFLCCHSFPD